MADVLDRVDLTATLDRDEYRRQLAVRQVELRHLAYRLYREQRALVVVFEGWDAAGKGGNIRRVTEKLDPRGYHVWQVAAPEGDDAKHQYLWRFWRRLIPPEEKQITIFDRSWYGRVMVERVEGFATEPQWQRAYREINEFERQLVDADWMLVKFWFHISAQEQLARFQSRKATAHKRWKLTEEDWRNRDRWDAYRDAVEEMLERTSTRQAPWTPVAGNCKRWARVQTLSHLVDVLTDQLGPVVLEAGPTEPAED